MLVDLEQFRADVVDARPSASFGLGSPGHAAAILVREGELALRVGDEDHRIGRDTWAFASAEANAVLVVERDAPAGFLHIVLPSSERGRRIVVRRAGGSEGEKITDRPERRATILVDTPELTLSEFDYGAGERGAKPHVHRRHTDAFLVVDGEFAFHLRDGSRGISAGTLVAFPPGVAHGFDNDSADRARCFNFHMPSFGFADYLRGRNPDFDQHDPPEDGGVDPAAAVVARVWE